MLLYRFPAIISVPAEGITSGPGLAGSERESAVWQKEHVEIVPSAGSVPCIKVKSMLFCYDVAL